MPFTMTMRNILVKCYVFTLFCRSEIIVRTAVSKFGNLNAVGIIGFWGGRGQLAALDHQRIHGHSSQMDSRIKATIRIV